MGYSTSVPCKSAKARDELAGFLEHNLVPWSTLTKGTKLELDPDWDYTRFVRVGDELSYGSGPSRIGFNFSTQSEPGYYMWAILKWSAMQVGRKTIIKKVSSLGPVPYVTYDGYDHIPVLLRDEHEPTEQTKYFIVDQYGCEEIRSLLPKVLEWIEQNKLRAKLIRSAMMELDKKWKAR